MGVIMGQERLFSTQEAYREGVVMDQPPLEEGLLRKKKRRANCLNTLFWVVMAVLLVFVIFVNTFQLCLVMGSSMNNTLYDTEYLLMQKRLFDVDRGDIITVYVDRRDDYPIIKRVIGIRGDRLVFMSDEMGGVELYLDKGNGFQRLDEPYIKDGKMSERVFGQLDKFAFGFYKISPKCEIGEVLEEYIIEVEDGVFVLGDNRDDSYDSRHYGILSYENVEGKMLTELKKGSFAEKFLKILFNAD